MGCLREVEDGSVRILGHELHGADEATFIACRRRLGFIFQGHNLHESLTALQNVRMGLDVHGRLEGADAASAHLLTVLGLSDRIDAKPARVLSGRPEATRRGGSRAGW